MVSLATSIDTPDICDRVMKAISWPIRYIWKAKLLT